MFNLVESTLVDFAISFALDVVGLIMKVVELLIDVCAYFV
jgi:hypothetical protein